MYVELNVNPAGNRVGDCVVRALACAMEQDWDTVYAGIVAEGFLIKDMPSSNAVWGSYLIRNGYERKAIPNTCPICYSVREFCNDHPEGTYILATGNHAVAVKQGNYFDTWDSGDEVPAFYFERG